MGVSAFRNEVIECVYTHMYHRVDDNFDFARYSYDGVDRSNIVSPIENARYLQFFLDNIESFFAASLLFADTGSRNLLIQLIKYRSLGHPHIRIRDNITWASINQLLEQAASYVVGPSTTGFSGQFGQLQHHENVPTESGPISIDTWTAGVAYGLGIGNHRQYYFDRGGVRICPEVGDWMVDGGACFGDTSMFFSSSVTAEGKVFAFEPLPAHLDVVRFNVAQNSFGERVRVVPAGIDASSNHLSAIGERLKSISNPGFSLRGLEGQVPTLSIDDFVADQRIEKLNFVKLDIEGYELNALKGAHGTINQFRPKLAISLYHKPGDFFEIPIYLKTLYPFYELYLDHYTIFSEETVLYAAPR